MRHRFLLRPAHLAAINDTQNLGQSKADSSIVRAAYIRAFTRQVATWQASYLKDITRQIRECCKKQSRFPKIGNNYTIYIRKYKVGVRVRDRLGLQSGVRLG